MRRALDFNIGKNFPSEHRTATGYLAAVQFDRRAIHGHARIQSGGQSRGLIFALNRGTNENHRRTNGLNQIANDIGVGIRCVLCQGRIIGHQYFIRPIFFQFPGNTLNARADDHGSQIAAQTIGDATAFTDGFERHFAKNTISLFCNNKHSLCHIDLLYKQSRF